MLENRVFKAWIHAAVMAYILAPPLIVRVMPMRWLPVVHAQTVESDVAAMKEWEHNEAARLVDEERRLEDHTQRMNALDVRLSKIEGADALRDYIAALFGGGIILMILKKYFSGELVSRDNYNAGKRKHADADEEQ